MKIETERKKYGKNKRRNKTTFKASLTIEAAIVLPVFMFFVIAIIYLLVIISLQTDIQLAMDEAARSLGKEAYLSAAQGEEVSIGKLAVRSAVFTDELREKIENSQIRSGVSGISTARSSYDEESAILDIVLTYTYEIPFLPENFNRFRFIQRMRSRVWIGKDIDEEAGSEAEGEIVYITPTGTVYHTTTQCPYLDLSISSVAFSDVSAARNKSGAKYSACTTCCKSSTYTTVYVTDYGTSYHSTLSCSKLKRTVLAVDISEVGSRSACSKCGGE